MRIAYVGCRTTRERNARGNGLAVFRIDEQSGAWEQIQLLPMENPSYQVVDQTGGYLYTVHGDMQEVSSFAICGETGKLTQLNTAPAGGKNPVFLSISPDNRHLYVATLQGGAVSTLLRQEDGTVTIPEAQHRFPGKGEDGFSFAHQCMSDNTGRYMFVPTQGRGIGYGAVHLFRMEDNGVPRHIQELRAREYDEPRHVAVHPNNRYVYGINERGNSVTFFLFDGEKGQLAAKQIVPILPQTYVGEGQASAVLVHPSGRFVYASNRIHDSVALLRVDPHTGYLAYVDCTPCLGKTPRFMLLEKDGSRLYVANEDSDTIRVFSVDEGSGALRFADQTIETPSPTCIVLHEI